MGQLLAVLVATYAVNWIVQPISYFGVFGTAGTYMAWLSGSVGDIRAPAVRMAQKISEYDAGTNEGDVMATLGIASSTFISMPILTLFVFIGSAVLGLIPETVQSAFVFILPAMYGGVYADMMQSNIKVGILTLIASTVFVAILPLLGVPSAFIVLFAVIAGMLFAHITFKTSEKK